MSFGSFLTRVEPVKDTEGRVVRWFGTNTDITEQRRTEEELRRMNRELEEFAYVAESRSPGTFPDGEHLYPIDSVRNPGLPKKEDLRQYSAFVQEGVKRMEVLIRDLLTFSRTIHAEALPVGIADRPRPPLRSNPSVLKATLRKPAPRSRCPLFRARAVKLLK